MLQQLLAQNRIQVVQIDPRMFNQNQQIMMIDPRESNGVFNNQRLNLQNLQVTDLEKSFKEWGLTLKNMIERNMNDPMDLAPAQQLAKNIAGRFKFLAIRFKQTADGLSGKDLGEKTGKIGEQFKLEADRIMADNKYDVKNLENYTAHIGNKIVEMIDIIKSNSDDKTVQMAERNLAEWLDQERHAIKDALDVAKADGI